ncbi:sucrase ferredoxin [Okeania sp. SIO2C9]|uniref:sucrase ferredoxin n=1 Tax=Okeania sp. SIO2C9 TaxID=2607791 RepID=UPI0025F568CF|nr:sucrase ferredoxin [Okeania sp. SIO2C9]
MLKELQQQPNELENFQQYQQQTSQIREMLVCTHANVDVACGRFGYPIYKKLRSEYAATSQGNLRVWRCSHFGGHQFAPTLVDLPDGRYWGHLEPEMLDLLVLRNGSVSGLRKFYRGWAGLNSFAQIAEREMWMQEGWSWLKYPKTGKVLAFDEERLKHLSLEEAKVEANWALVQLEFIVGDDSNLKKAYEAKVEVNGQVMSALRSSDDMKLTPVKQYHVSSMVKVS